MANRVTTNNGLQLGNNPFAYAQQKGNQGKPQKNVFNTPFGQSNINPNVGIDNTGGYSESYQEDDNSLDFNFVADPPTNNEGQFSTIPPDGGPATNFNNQHQNNGQYNSNYQQNQQMQQQENPKLQNQQNKLRGVLPNQNRQNVQQQPMQMNQQTPWGQDEMISLDEIEPEQYQQNQKQNFNQQRQVPQNYGNTYNKFSAPFSQNQQPQMEKSPSQQSEEDEIPLLEDLEIDLEKIKAKFISIMTQRGIKENADYDDMAGPLLVCVFFGLFLLFVSSYLLIQTLQKGKVQFGYIYGFGLSGCFGIYLIINLMSKHTQYVEFYKTMSILGYSLLPFIFLSSLAIFLDLYSIVGAVASLLIITWSTVTATRYFEYGLDMEDKKYLIAYPISLFYFVFTLLTVF